jgi:hypothetical protein
MDIYSGFICESESCRHGVYGKFSPTIGQSFSEIVVKNRFCGLSGLESVRRAATVGTIIPNGRG